MSDNQPTAGETNPGITTASDVTTPAEEPTTKDTLGGNTKSAQEKSSAPKSKARATSKGDKPAKAKSSKTEKSSAKTERRETRLNENARAILRRMGVHLGQPSDFGNKMADFIDAHPNINVTITGDLDELRESNFVSMIPDKASTVPGVADKDQPERVEVNETFG